MCLEPRERGRSAAEPACGRSGVAAVHVMALGPSCKSPFTSYIAGAVALAAAWLIPFIGSLSSYCSVAAEPTPRSILVLDQSDVTSPFYYSIFSGLRSTVTADRDAAISLYVESLDLSRFAGSDYEASLTSHLRTKYGHRPPRVLVAIGARSLQLALRLRPELWPEVPLVFCMVDEPTFNRLNLGPGVTGSVLRLRLSDMVTV